MPKACFLIAANLDAGFLSQRIELDPIYADVCVSRLQAELGEPIRLETGETFEEVRERRLGLKEEKDD